MQFKKIKIEKDNIKINPRNIRINPRINFYTARVDFYISRDDYSRGDFSRFILKGNIFIFLVLILISSQ